MSNSGLIVSKLQGIIDLVKIFNLHEMFNEGVCLGGKENGRFLRNEVEIALSSGSVVVDFDHLPLITQSFSDEFLGPIVAHEGKKVFDQLTFKNCSEDIQVILTSTAGRFLAHGAGAMR